MRTEQQQRVVVVGGGYAGTIAALRIAGRSRRRAHVLLVDAKDHFVQRLRLHQVATGQKVAAPAYAELLGRKVEFVPARVEGIDLAAGRVELSGGAVGELAFDWLVYALGSNVDMTAVPGVSEFAHCVGDEVGARLLHDALVATPDGSRVAVVGGGLTGLEAAAEIAHRHPRLHTMLVTSGQAGGWLSERGRAHLERALSRLEIERVEGSEVLGVQPDGLRLANGAELPAAVVVWCGGFRASPVAAESGLRTDPLGRVLVDRALRSINHANVIAAGDGACTPAFAGGASLRMCCQVAMPAAAHAGDVVAAELAGREPAEFHFGYVHQPISLGRRDGLIQFVDRADAPKGSVLTGRRAAFYKEVVTAGGLGSIRLERRFTGATRWPFKEPAASATHDRGLPSAVAGEGESR